eukprot:TRINITY_DN63603_c0_g1_i2.p2 TRINITY_DN63603_c0_g1~~TRINITY_DN63603_c0_g1_i2.p2  ORF type:complete len:140 (+),score=43.77 TRINITY_DN63603_c0_g1_i2:1442-1861(+)
MLERLIWSNCFTFVWWLVDATMTWWTAERRKWLKVLNFSWPLLTVSGVVLYRRFFGTEEEKQRWIQHKEKRRRVHERNQEREAGLAFSSVSDLLKIDPTSKMLGAGEPSQIEQLFGDSQQSQSTQDEDRGRQSNDKSFE